MQRYGAAFGYCSSSMSRDCRDATTSCVWVCVLWLNTPTNQRDGWGRPTQTSWASLLPIVCRPPRARPTDRPGQTQRLDAEHPRLLCTASTYFDGILRHRTKKTAARGQTKADLQLLLLAVKPSLSLSSLDRERRGSPRFKT